MATYLELISLSDNANFINKVQFACVVAAETIRTESEATPNHAARIAWAKRVLDSPVVMARQMSWAVLAQNRGVTLAQINAATDSALQTAVDTAVNLFAV